MSQQRANLWRVSFILKAVAKLLSEKPEDISVIDLGGSLFNSRVAYYDDSTKTIYLIQSSDGGINLSI